MLQERTLVDLKWNEPGMAVSGTLVSIRKTDFEGKPGLAYTVLAEDGRVVRFFGSLEINHLIFPADIGHFVSVRFVEEERISPDKTRKHFRVRVSKDRMPVAASATRDPERLENHTNPTPVPAMVAGDAQMVVTLPGDVQMVITDDDIPF